MNWVGGTRNRLRNTNEEQKRQKEFFERRKLANRAKRATSLSTPVGHKKSVSRDILHLQCVTHTKRSSFEAEASHNLKESHVNQTNGSSSELRSINHIDLRGRSKYSNNYSGERKLEFPRTHKRKIHLPNASPCKRPSSIEFADATDDEHVKSRTFRHLPSYHSTPIDGFPKRGWSQYSDGKRVATKYTREKGPLKRANSAPSFERNFGKPTQSREEVLAHVNDSFYGNDTVLSDGVCNRTRSEKRVNFSHCNEYHSLSSDGEALSEPRSCFDVNCISGDKPNIAKHLFSPSPFDVMNDTDVSTSRTPNKSLFGIRGSDQIDFGNTEEHSKDRFEPSLTLRTASSPSLCFGDRIIVNSKNDKISPHSGRRKDVVISREIYDDEKRFQTQNVDKFTISDLDQTPVKGQSFESMLGRSLQADEDFHNKSNSTGHVFGFNDVYRKYRKYFNNGMDLKETTTTRDNLNTWLKVKEEQRDDHCFLSHCNPRDLNQSSLKLDLHEVDQDAFVHSGKPRTTSEIYLPFCYNQHESDNRKTLGILPCLNETLTETPRLPTQQDFVEAPKKHGIVSETLPSWNLNEKRINLCELYAKKTLDDEKQETMNHGASGNVLLLQSGAIPAINNNNVETIDCEKDQPILIEDDDPFPWIINNGDGLPFPDSSTEIVTSNENSMSLVKILTGENMLVSGTAANHENKDGGVQDEKQNAEKDNTTVEHVKNFDVQIESMDILSQAIIKLNEFSDERNAFLIQTDPLSNSNNIERKNEINQIFLADVTEKSHEKKFIDKALSPIICYEKTFRTKYTQTEKYDKQTLSVSCDIAVQTDVLNNSQVSITKYPIIELGDCMLPGSQTNINFKQQNELFSHSSDDSSPNEKNSSSKKRRSKRIKRFKPPNSVDASLV